MPHTIDRTMRECIAECQSCHASCLETVQHCLGMGGEHAGARHIGLLLACAEMCQACANIMLTGSDFHMRSCQACAEVCGQCAEECRRMANGDETMMRCAEVCSRCAESCERMAAMPQGSMQ